MFGVPCPVLHSIASGVLVWSSFSVGVIAARTCSILFLNCTVLRVLTGSTLPLKKSPYV